ncbi:hypothetical protein TNCV_1410581, partial [Trichonephila clavipes]
MARTKEDDRPRITTYIAGVCVRLPSISSRCPTPLKRVVWERTFMESSNYYLSQDMEWFHIMVKHDAFPIFCRELETIRDEFVLLPFWCLCDGLE